MIKFRYIVLAASLITAMMLANAATKLTLDSCKQLAIANNIKMRTALANIEAAKEDKSRAATAFYPLISATGMAYTTDNGIVSIGLLHNLDIEMMKKGMMGGITAVMPIFAGGQIYHANKLAETGIEVNKLYLEQSRHEVELTAEQYYWQIVSLKEKERTLKASEDLVNRLNSDVSTAVDAGIAMRNDLLKVQLKQNELESAKSNLENNIAICKMMLAQYIGMDDSDFDVEGKLSTDTLPAFPYELNRNPDDVVGTTPEYRLLQKNVEANRLKYKQELGKNLPTVVAGASYMYHNVFFEQDHSFGSLFATVTIPISGWWGGSHTMKKQKIQLDNAQRDLDDKSELLKIKMQKSWIDLENAYKQLVIASKSIEQADENLRLNNDYYHAGTIAMSDLLDAISMQQQCRDKFVESYSAFQTKKLEYKQATGQE